MPLLLQGAQSNSLMQKLGWEDDRPKVSQTTLMKENHKWFGSLSLNTSGSQCFRRYWMKLTQGSSGFKFQEREEVRHWKAGQLQNHPGGPSHSQAIGTQNRAHTKVQPLSIQRRKRRPDRSWETGKAQKQCKKIENVRVKYRQVASSL